MSSNSVYLGKKKKKLTKRSKVHREDELETKLAKLASKIGKHQLASQPSPPGYRLELLWHRLELTNITNSPTKLANNVYKHANKYTLPS